jgi:hypothetical protein
LTDALTFGATSGVMLAGALLASDIPADRASSVDPMAARRGDQPPPMHELARWRLHCI